MIKHEFLEDDGILSIEPVILLHSSDFDKLISKVAAVTDEGIIAILPAIANRFVDADIRHFGDDDLDKAIQWIKQY